MKFATLALPSPSVENLRYSDVRAARRKHAGFAWAGLRPPIAQHTPGEHKAIERWARGRNVLVEIGVAEGVSALALRENMAEQGRLVLIDPFHLSRLPALNFTKRVAHRVVSDCSRGTVEWIEKFSHDAVLDWKTPIDLIVIDGDHTEAGVERDWNDWSPFVKPGGVAIFHDARVSEGCWTEASQGPVKLVTRLFRERENPNWKVVDEVHTTVVVERVA